MRGIQARAAATLDGNPVEVGVAPGPGAEFGVGRGVGLTGSGMIHLEERRSHLSRQLEGAFLFLTNETAGTIELS
jgi:hypothetical protein